MVTINRKFKINIIQIVANSLHLYFTKYLIFDLHTLPIFHYQRKTTAYVQKFITDLDTFKGNILFLLSHFYLNK